MLTSPRLPRKVCGSEISDNCGIRQKGPTAKESCSYSVVDRSVFDQSQILLHLKLAPEVVFTVALTDGSH